MAFGSGPRAFQAADRDLQELQLDFGLDPEVEEFLPRDGLVLDIQLVGEPEGRDDDDGDDDDGDDDDEEEEEGEEEEEEENARRSEGEDDVEYPYGSGPGEVRQEALGSDRGGSDSEDGVRDQQLPAGVEAEGGRSGLRVSGVGDRKFEKLIRLVLGMLRLG